MTAGNVCELCLCGHFVGDPCLARCLSDTCPNARGFRKLERPDRGDAPRERHGWAVETGVPCVVCPGCAFTFDACHEDASAGGYSCPSCGYGSPEDVRGADVGERTARALDIADAWLMNDEPTARETFAAMHALRKEVARLAALRSPEPARFTEADWKRALEWRGLTPDEVCGDCMGTGRKAYGSTATWRRGAYGGSSITEDVCDRCWGTGSQARTGADLRELSAIARSPEPAAEPVEALEIAWGIIANAYGGNWDLATEEWREAAIRWRDEHWHPRLPTAEPVAWGVWENSRFQFADHKEIAARAMAEDIRGFPDCRGEVEVRALYAHPPSAEPATGRDQKMGVTEREVPSAGGEPRYTLAEAADLIAAEINRVRGNGTEGWSNVTRWLRSRGATTETGESE